MDDKLKEIAAAMVARRQADMRAAIAWLEEKWGDRACPYCGDKQWQVGTPLELATGSGTMAPMSPAVPVMCGNCGNTVMINAVIAGLRPDEPQRDTP